MKRVESQNQRFYLSGESHANETFSPEDFTDEDELIAKTAEQFIKQDVSPHIPSIENHNYDITRRLFKKAGELGLLGIEVPESYGGLSLNKKISGLVAEKIGYGGSFSVSFNIHAGVGILPFIYFGTEVQKQKYLPCLSSGEWIGAYALTESNAGSDALHPRTTAVLSEDGSSWKLNGEKQWITNAGLADVFVVFAKTFEGMTAFIIERTYEGVSIGPEEEKLGIKGSSTASLILDNVKVPKENVLGTVGKGHHIALNILNLARLKLAFSNIGTAKQALQLAVNYGKERKQFDKALVDFTMIKEKIANMAVKIYGAESAAYRTADELDRVLIPSIPTKQMINNISSYALECSVNKVYCSEALGVIVDEAVQIHGGYGYMQEYEVERLYRDARISRIFEGTNEINRLTIAKIFLKKNLQNKLLARTPFPKDMNTGRNQQYIQLSSDLLNDSLKTLSSKDNDLEQEQEYLRMIADMVQEIYVMESALLRTKKAAGKNIEDQIKLYMTDIICEEGFQKIKQTAITLIAAAEADKEIRKININKITQLEQPINQNLISKKREIAQAVINRPKYFK